MIVTRSKVIPLLRRCVRAAKACPDPGQQQLMLLMIRNRFDRERLVTPGSFKARELFQDAEREVIEMEDMLSRKYKDATEKQKRLGIGSAIVVPSQFSSASGSQGSRQEEVTAPEIKESFDGGQLHERSVGLVLPATGSKIDFVALTTLASCFGPLASCSLDRSNQKAELVFESRDSAAEFRRGFPTLDNSAK